MGVSRRQRKRCTAVFAVFIAAMGVAFGFSAPVGAADEASGSAFGVSARGLIDIEPEPLVVFPPGGDETTIEVDAGSLLLACVLNAQTRGLDGDGNVVTNVEDAERVESEASVADATLLGDAANDCENGEAGQDQQADLLDDLLDLIGEGAEGLNLGLIQSSCFADENGVGGESSVANLEEDLIIELGLDLDLGILEIVLDEQIVDEDGNGITVRAVRITLLPGDDLGGLDLGGLLGGDGGGLLGGDGGLLGGDGGGADEPLLEIILAESQCRLVPDENPTTTTSSTTSTTSSTTTTTVAGPDNDADNDADLSNDSDGTAVIETGDATAVGNISNTEINQTANAAGGGVDQDATVINEGSANANTGGNAAIGNNSLNVVKNRQSAAANFGRTTTGTIPGASSASNSSSASNTSDGLAAIKTGDANAAGNVSDTEINQTGNAAGRRTSVDQDAKVGNFGEANANTGNNAAIGNNSANFVGNEQEAAAVGDNGTVDPCCPEPGGANTAGNTSTATNTSDGTAAISTGDAAAVGNVSETAIDQNASATGGCGGNCPPEPCGETCKPEPCGGTCQPEPCGETCKPEPCGECPEQCPNPEPECPEQCPEPEPECPEQCPDPEPCEEDPCDDPCDRQPCGGTCGNPWTHGFGWSSVSQSATVVNSGSASANTGGNAAVGNNSTNIVTNRQTAVAAGDD
ncbi:MAG TPA: hypothetical protein VGR26_10980 [Acidimicrobiales bacterium]|nr:hypothetical protein [Acidimicrobiales bacterium]